MKLARPTQLLAPGMLIVIFMMIRLGAAVTTDVPTTGSIAGPILGQATSTRQPSKISPVKVAVQVHNSPTPVPTLTPNQVPPKAQAPVEPKTSLVRQKVYSNEMVQFINQVKDGEPGVVRGVEVDGIMALPVVQQPKDDWAYVSTTDGIATQFSSASANGVTGLLAHNFLAGRLFYNIKLGQDVNIVFGDGSVRTYRVDEISSFQKLNSQNLYSDMIDLKDGQKLSSSQIFGRFYTGNDHVTLQTCLEKNGDPSWGLTFIVATPLN